MEPSATARPLLTLARLIGLVAVVLTLSIYTILVFFNPNEWVGDFPIIFWNLFFALLATWGVLQAKPSLLFLAFFFSFAHAGWYTLLFFDNFIRWIGLGNILYLVAGTLMFISLRLAGSRYREAAR